MFICHTLFAFIPASSYGCFTGGVKVVVEKVEVTPSSSSFTVRCLAALLTPPLRSVTRPHNASLCLCPPHVMFENGIRAAVYLQRRFIKLHPGLQWAVVCEKRVRDQLLFMMSPQHLWPQWPSTWLLLPALLFRVSVLMHCNKVGCWPALLLLVLMR